MTTTIPSSHERRGNLRSLASWIQQGNYLDNNRRSVVVDEVYDCLSAVVW